MSPKVYRLSNDQLGLLVKLWCCADYQTGKLPSDMADMEFYCRVPNLLARINELIDSGFIDIGVEGGFVIHDWHDHQRKSDRDLSTIRSRKHRERKRRNASCNEDATRCATENASSFLPSSSFHPTNLSVLGEDVSPIHEVGNLNKGNVTRTHTRTGTHTHPRSRSDDGGVA